MIQRTIEHVLSGSLSLHGTGYHNGFTIPAGVTCIQITEDPFNRIVFLGTVSAC